jgi:hypothetical protein
MRALLVTVALSAVSVVASVVASGVAHADGRIAFLITGYEKEARACQIQLDGVTKVAVRGQALYDDTKDDALKPDLDALATGKTAVDAYCGEVKAILDVLQADPKATYKSLEKDLDERDNKIRKLRAASKKTIEGLQPVMQRLIPKINARVGAAQPAEARTPGTFPSGRKVELPAVPGTWKVSGSVATDILEYSDKTTRASVTVYPFSSATCDQQRKALAAKADRLDEADASELAKTVKVAWYVAYTKNGRVTQAACAAGKAGGWMALVEAPVGATLPLGTVMARMLAAQIAQP